MAFALKDRIQETTTTTGTGTITLAGAVTGFQSFAAVGNGNTTYYCITSGSAWEVGLGTYSTTGPTLARTTIYSNSLGTTITSYPKSERADGTILNSYNSISLNSGSYKPTSRPLDPINVASFKVWLSSVTIVSGL